MDIGSALSKMAITTAHLKLSKLLENDEELAKGFTAETERIAAECTTIPETAAERLVGYKTVIGDEMFTSLAANPKLQEMADSHWKEIANAQFVQMVDELHVFLADHDISRDEIHNALVGSIEH